MPYRTQSSRFGFIARYTVLFALAFALLCLGAGGVYYLSAKRAFNASLDHAVDRLARLIRATEDPSDWPREAKQGLNALAAEHVYGQVHVGDGRLLAVSDRLAQHALPLPSSDLEPPETAFEPYIADDALASRIAGPDAVLSVAPRRVVHPSGQSFWIIAAKDWQPTQDALHRNLMAIGIAFLLSLIAAGFTLWVILRRAVAPIRQVLEQAEGFDPRSLSLRLDVPSGPEDVRNMVIAVNEALDRIEVAFDAHTRFMANVSHELKTPLTYLFAQTQLARRGPHDPDSFDRYLDNTELELRRMHETIEGLMTLARATSGQETLPTSRIPANDVVLDAVEHCQALARYREIRIEPILMSGSEGQAPPMLEGDHDLLSVMIENLIRNAIQHSPTEGKVTVSVGTEDRQAHLVVRDQGPGIPSESLPRLFEAYYQVHPGEQENGFARKIGLGLAISRAIARMHGGDVAGENNPDGGAIFAVTLPLVDATT